MAVKPWTDKRGRKRWKVEFEQSGHRIFRRLPPGATKAQANELELQRRHELIDQDVLDKSPTVGLSWAIQEWFDNVVVGRKDEGATRSKVALVRAAIGDDLKLTKKGVTEAAQRIVKMPRQKSHKGDGPLTVATRNRRFAVVKGTCKWAWKTKHWTPENLSPYVAMIDKAQELVRDRHISQSVLEKLLRHAPNFEARAFIAMTFYTLMREGEVMKLEPHHAARGTIKVKDRKNGSTIMLPILPELKPFVKAIPFKHHVRTLYGWFEEARDAAGIDDLVVHDLRRSGATVLLNKGVPLEVVARILGDSMEVARKHYAHVLDKTVAKAMRKGFRPIKNPSAKSRTGVSA